MNIHIHLMMLQYHDYMYVKTHAELVRERNNLSNERREELLDRLSHHICERNFHQQHSDRDFELLLNQFPKTGK